MRLFLLLVACLIGHKLVVCVSIDCCAVMNKQGTACIYCFAGFKKVNDGKKCESDDPPDPENQPTRNFASSIGGAATAVGGSGVGQGGG